MWLGKMRQGELCPAASRDPAGTKCCFSTCHAIMVSEEIKGAALLSRLGAVPGLRHRLTHRETMSTEEREQPLRFSWPDVGSSRLWGKKPLSFMAYDSDLGRSVASEPHALPEMAPLHPPRARPPSPSLAGVFRPSQDPTHTGQGGVLWGLAVGELGTC